MRKSLLKTGLTVALLICAFLPLTVYLSGIQADLAVNDAAHVIEPMIRLYAQSAANSADSPVLPVMDIEEIWALEDTRREAASPLLAGMRNSGSALGYNAADQTFYCTIGIEFPDETWPEVTLFAQSADSKTPVHVAFVDDYTYDYPSEAVADGYRYELFAYTESEYQYLGLVFTGLPIVTIHTESHIAYDYIPACASISSASSPGITSMAQIHRRGGGLGKGIPKWSYRFEFQALTRTGRAADTEIDVLNLGSDSDWLLLSNAANKEAVHNDLAFDLWNRWEDNHHQFMQQKSTMVELFIQDEYMGLYQLMERVEPEQEILDAGGSLDTDMAVRVIRPFNSTDRPVCDIGTEALQRFEYLYAPSENADRAFRIASHYANLNGWLDESLSDEAFAQLAETYMDIDELMSFYLFHQIVGLTWDNVTNNTYLYMLTGTDRMTIHLAPWDMDGAFFYGYYKSEPIAEYYLADELICAVRMLDLNVGNCRKILHDLYHQKRETVLSDEAIEQWIMQADAQIAASGAYLRESEKWYGESSRFSLDELLAFELDHVVRTEAYFQERWPVP